MPLPKLSVQNMKEMVHDTELNLELLVVTEVMKLNSLHYAFWDETPEEIDLDDVREGQTRYTERLIQCFPQDVNRVLDIGCGIGDNALAMADAGLIVTALSPDENHGKFFNGKTSNIKFIQTKFEDLDIEETFDLALMSESQNYFDLYEGLLQSNRYLRDGGYLLISGNFRLNNTTEFDTAHVLDHYREEAIKYGFEEVMFEDITENVIPTLDFTRKQFHAYLLPVLDVTARYAQKEMPRRSWLVRKFLGKQLNKFQDMLDYYDEFLDTTKYRKNMAYVHIMFKKVNGHP